MIAKVIFAFNIWPKSNTPNNDNFCVDLDLDVIEARVKFLIGLLEKCRDQLESEAKHEDIKLDEWRQKVEQYRETYHGEKEVANEDESVDSLTKEVQKYFIENFHPYSEKKMANQILI